LDAARIPVGVALASAKAHPVRRWVVERTPAWFKGFCTIPTRYTRWWKNYFALLYLACALVLSQQVEAIA
jgi:putative transposase